MNNKLLLTKEENRNSTATEYSREQPLENDTGKTWGWGQLISLIWKGNYKTLLIIALRAFSSNMSKNIAFKISKHYFIYFNTPLYNISNIKVFFFFFFCHFIKILFILIKWERKSGGERHKLTAQERVREREKKKK